MVIRGGAKKRILHELHVRPGRRFESRFVVPQSPAVQFFVLNILNWSIEIILIIHSSLHLVGGTVVNLGNFQNGCL